MARISTSDCASVKCTHPPLVRIPFLLSWVGCLVCVQMDRDGCPCWLCVSHGCCSAWWMHPQSSRSSMPPALFPPTAGHQPRHRHPRQTRAAHRGGQVRGHLDGCARPPVGAVGSHGGWAHQPVASGETHRVASCMGKRERESCCMVDGHQPTQLRSRLA